MKKNFLLLLMFASSGALMAQDFVAPMPGAGRTAPARALPSPAIGGAVALIVQARHPAQMINPLAPKELGTGSEQVYYSTQRPASSEPQPKGIRLFSITFW